MGRTGSNWRRLVAGLVVAGVLAAAVAPAHAGSAMLGRVCVRDIKGLIDKVGNLVEKVAPGSGAQVTAGATMMLQGAEWAGVDWSKPATVAILSGKPFGKAEPAVVAILPLTDPGKFRQAREQAAKPNQNFDVRGNFGLITQDEGALAAITPKRLELYTQFPKLAGSADVYATFYITRAVTEYEAEIDQAMQKAQEQVAGMGAAGPFAVAAKAQKAVAPLAKLAGKQARRVSMVWKFNDDSLDVTGRLYAAPDSQLAAFFAGQPGETTDLVKYLPSDAAVAMAGKLDIAKLMPLVKTVLDAIAGPLEMKPEDQQKVLDLFLASTQTGEFAIAVSGNPAHKGMQTIQVVKIADGGKFRKAAKQGMDWFLGSGLGAMVKGMGVEMALKQEPAVRKHKDVAVDRFTMTIAQAPDAQPNPLMGQAPPQVTELAAIDTLGIAASNNLTGDLLNATIDRVKGGGEGLDQSKAYKDARAAAPQDANIIFHVSFNSILAKVIEEVAKQQPMIAMMAGGIAKADPTEAPITGYYRFSKDQVDFLTHVPYQPIIAFGTRVRMMIQQQRGAMQPGMRAPAKKKADDDF